MRPNFLGRRQAFEKTGRKVRFWALFRKICPKNCVFGARFPLKYILTPMAPLEKLNCRLAENGCHKMIPEGIPFGWRGVKSLKKEAAYYETSKRGRGVQ